MSAVDFFLWSILACMALLAIVGAYATLGLILDALRGDEMKQIAAEIKRWWSGR